MRATLYNAQQGHTAIMGLWLEAKSHLMAGRRMVIELKEATRSLEQNSRMWAMLTDVSKQVDWYGRKLTPEEVVLAIRAMSGTGRSIARQLGMAEQTVSRIRRGESHRDLLEKV